MSDVGNWKTGGTPSRTKPEYFGGSIPWVKSGDLNDGVVFRTEELITEVGIVHSAAKVLPRGSILIALYGATIGRLGVLDIDAAMNQACAGCIPNGAIEPQFLFYQLLWARPKLIEAGQGGAQPNISNQIIRDWKCFVPPLAEQRRIVEKLDELLARTSHAVRRLKDAARAIQALRASALVHIVRGDGSTAVPVGNLGKWVSGGTPDRSKSEYWDRGDIPWVSPKDMKRDFLDDAQEHITQLAVQRSTARVLPPGCVLVVVRGMILAHSFPVAVNRVPVAVNQDIRALIPRQGVDARFVLRTLQANRITALERVKEATHGTRRLESNDLFSIEVNLPSEDIQRRSAAQVEQLIQMVSSAEERVVSALRNDSLLTQTILARAFGSKLVPTEAELARREGRPYEPAAALLDRLRADRDGTVTESTGIAKRGITNHGARSRRA